ncbi:MAG: RloB family protein [Thermoflexibacter sp.]|jgi:hypothetical protein|nr:RloB family protein [Thermoflexibacter sp.]
MRRKNKQAEEKAKRQEARQRRRQATNLARPAPQRVEKQKILIVCEGKNTETSYFNQFKLSNATIKAVGEGYNTLSLVERAKQLSQESDYDQVWCVFDKDDFNAEDFNNAIQKANSLGLGIAYSNQAFEYWLLLHLEDHQGGAMHRDLYYDKINAYLKKFGLEYDKNSKIVTPEIFDKFQEIIGEDKKIGKKYTIQDVAIQRARRIYENLAHANRAKEESSTKVFELVEELEKYR